MTLDLTPDDAATFTSRPTQPLTVDALNATRVLLDRAREVERIAASPRLRDVARAALTRMSPLATDDVTVFDGRHVVVSKWAEGTALESRQRLALHLGAHMLTPAEWDAVQRAVASAMNAAPDAEVGSRTLASLAQPPKGDPAP